MRRFDIPECPDDIYSVRDSNGVIYARKSDKLWYSEYYGKGYSWGQILEFGPIYENIVPPTEFDFIRAFINVNLTDEEIQKSCPNETERIKELCERFKRAYTEGHVW